MFTDPVDMRIRVLFLRSFSPTIKLVVAFMAVCQTIAAWTERMALNLSSILTETSVQNQLALPPVALRYYMNSLVVYMGRIFGLNAGPQNFPARNALSGYPLKINTCLAPLGISTSRISQGASVLSSPRSPEKESWFFYK